MFERRAIFAGAVSVVAIATAAFGPAGAKALAVADTGEGEAEESWSIPPGEADLAGMQAYQKVYGLDEEQATLLVKRHELVQAWTLEQQKNPAFINAAAGGWIDVENGMTFFIATSSPTMKASLEAQRLPSWVVVVLVPRSYEELQAISDKLQGATMELLGESIDPSDDLTAGGSGWSAEIDVRANAVVVDLPESVPSLGVAARAALAAMDTSFQSAVQLRQTSTPPSEGFAQSCTSAASCGSPLRGGIFATQNGSPYPDCTYGFIYRNPASGQQYASTAGHCASTYWRHDGVGIGSTAFSRQSGSTDVQFINIDNNAAWKSTNAVWKPHSEQWSISGVAVPNTALVGNLVCHTGLGMWYFLGGTNESCGTLSSVSYSNGNWNQMGRVAGAWGCAGDSGGPWEYAHTAFGLHRGIASGLGSVDCGLGDHVEGNGTTTRVMFTWVTNTTGTTGGFGVGVRVY